MGPTTVAFQPHARRAPGTSIAISTIVRTWQLLDVKACPPKPARAPRPQLPSATTFASSAALATPAYASAADAPNHAQAAVHVRVTSQKTQRWRSRRTRCRLRRLAHQGRRYCSAPSAVAGPVRSTLLPFVHLDSVVTSTFETLVPVTMRQRQLRTAGVWADRARRRTVADACSQAQPTCGRTAARDLCRVASGRQQLGAALARTVGAHRPARRLAHRRRPGRRPLRRLVGVADRGRDRLIRSWHRRLTRAPGPARAPSARTPGRGR
jgi:hypothetical protein